jgi:Cu-processing system permease protein
MSKVPSLFKYEFMNVARGKWLVTYAFLFAIFSQAVLLFGSEPGKAVASLMSIVLLVIPMVSALYSSIYWYNSDRFTMLLLTQPIRRGRIYLNRWIALSWSLSAGFLAGICLPLAMNRAFDGPVVLLLALGVVLTFIFTALGLAISVLMPDRMKGISLVFTAWLYLAIIHDSLVFGMISMLHDYPMEIPAMLLTAVDPIDLARLTVLLNLDMAALMGYTGTVLQRSLSTPLGGALISLALFIWVAVPMLGGLKVFEKMDF